MPSRLIDVGLRLTLLLRGRVPGGFTAAAHQAYARSPVVLLPQSAEVAGNPGRVAANAAAPVRSQPVDATCAGVESSEASASGRLAAPASASADAQPMTASGRIRTAPGASTPDASARW